jgi:hypothetical protein
MDASRPTDSDPPEGDQRQAARDRRVSTNGAALHTEHLHELELDRYLRQIDAIERDLHSLTDGLTRKQLTWSPAGNHWSIIQCIAHLNKATGLILDPMRKAIVSARAEGLTAEGPFAHSRLGAWFVRSMDPPPKFRVRSPDEYLPDPDVEPDVALQKFYALQDELRELVRQADGLDLGAITIPSPTGDLLQLTLGEWFGNVVAHERRHLWQARQVAAAERFPR